VGSNHASFAPLHPGLYADLAKLITKDELDDLVERRTAANEARCIWRYAGLSNRRQGRTVPLPSRPDLIPAPSWRRLRLAPASPILDARLKAAHDAD